MGLHWVRASIKTAEEMARNENAAKKQDALALGKYLKLTHYHSFPPLGPEKRSLLQSKDGTWTDVLDCS
jgi:hypothetical protein